MRITRTTSALIAAAVCGSLTMGLTGGVASAHAPVRITAVHLAPAADAADSGRADLIAKLGDTLSIGAKLTQEAQAQAPDSAKLDELRQGLEEATQQLSSVVDQAAASADPSAEDSSVPADPAADPQFAGVAQPADGSERAADAVSDVQAQLKKLVDDVTALVAAVVAKDLAGVTAGVTKVVADLQALLLSVPKLLTGLLPLPLPIPLPLEDESAQDPQAAPGVPVAPEAAAPPVQ
ncbi:hypothetical protein ABZ883_25025 [Streptomyces sp. NPDC046977]|uniref:hypothetical protein n=1 Tax=Streptomyces sp. NPDC046977 TaxID=3154703 RepID=UPI0033E56739